MEFLINCRNKENSRIRRMEENLLKNGSNLCDGMMMNCEVGRRRNRIDFTPVILSHSWLEKCFLLLTSLIDFPFFWIKFKLQKIPKGFEIHAGDEISSYNFNNCWWWEKSPIKGEIHNAQSKHFKMSYMSFLIRNSFHVVTHFCVCVCVYKKVLYCQRYPQ